MTLYDNVKHIQNWTGHGLKVHITKDDANYLFKKTSSEDVICEIPVNELYIKEGSYGENLLNLMKSKSIEKYVPIKSNERIEKLVKISDTFKKGGYPKVICHEWHSEVVDDKGHLKKVAGLLDNELEKIFKSVVIKRKEEAKVKNDYQNKMMAEAEDQLLSFIENEETV